MAKKYWSNKRCGHCGFRPTQDLEKVHCQKCGRDMCPACAGGVADDDSNVAYCRICAMQKVTERYGKSPAA